jgi:hypothetical protein
LAGDWQLIITNDFTSLTYPAFTSFDLDKILQKLSQGNRNTTERAHSLLRQSPPAGKPTATGLTHYSELFFNIFTLA